MNAGTRSARTPRIGDTPSLVLTIRRRTGRCLPRWRAMEEYTSVHVLPHLIPQRRRHRLALAWRCFRPGIQAHQRLRTQVVERGGRLPDLPSFLQRLERRTHPRPARHYLQARLPAEAGRECDLAEPAL